ncbi:MAG: hypothetical protein AAFY56_23200 [Pseudomonadota bacterium]
MTIPKNYEDFPIAMTGNMNTPWNFAYYEDLVTIAETALKSENVIVIHNGDSPNSYDWCEVWKQQGSVRDRKDCQKAGQLQISRESP